jgi:hypothetical protein
MAKKKKTTAKTKKVLVELVQVTVRFGEGGEGHFNYEIVADKKRDTPPPQAKFTSEEIPGCHPEDKQLLFDTLDKIKAAYCTGRVSLCVKGTRIVRDG